MYTFSTCHLKMNSFPSGMCELVKEILCTIIPQFIHKSKLVAAMYLKFSSVRPFIEKILHSCQSAKFKAVAAISTRNPG